MKRGGDWRLVSRGVATQLTRLGPALATLLFLGGCDTLPDYIKEDIQEMRLAETGLEGVDPTGTAPAAGLSILRQIEVEALNPRRIGADTTTQGFHRLVHRLNVTDCNVLQGSCMAHWLILRLPLIRLDMWPWLTP